MFRLRARSSFRDLIWVVDGHSFCMPCLPAAFEHQAGIGGTSRHLSGLRGADSHSAGGLRNFDADR